MAAPNSPAQSDPTVAKSNAPNSDMSNSNTPNSDTPNGMPAYSTTPNGVSPSSTMPSSNTPNSNAPSSTPPSNATPNSTTTNAHAGDAAAPPATASRPSGPSAPPPDAPLDDQWWTNHDAILAARSSLGPKHDPTYHRRKRLEAAVAQGLTAAGPRPKNSNNTSASGSPPKEANSTSAAGLPDSGQNLATHSPHTLASQSPHDSPPHSGPHNLAEHSAPQNLAPHAPTPAPPTTAAVPYWVPPGVAVAELPDDVRTAIVAIINPTYAELVINARPGLHQSTGLTVVHLLWLEIIDQLQLADAGDPMEDPLGLIKERRQDVIARHLRLIHAKLKASELLLRIQDLKPPAATFLDDDIYRHLPNRGIERYGPTSG